MKIDHITLYVSNLDLSMAYYRYLLSQLAFTQVREHIWTDEHGFFFQFAQAHVGTHPYQRFAAGMNHLGFKAKSVQQVEDIRQFMQTAGFVVPDIQRLGNSHALFMQDPDGIRFEITCYAEGESVVD